MPHPIAPRRLFAPALALCAASLAVGASSRSGEAVTPIPQQERRADPEAAFEAAKRRFDLNLDGKVDASEFTRSKRAFRQLDVDRDGFLTLADFKARSRRGKTEVAPPKESGAPDAAASTPGSGTRAMSDAEVEFFESRVRPVLANACYSCHSAESRRLKGGLRVDGRTHLLSGGTSGPAIVAGDPDASPLIEAIRYEDPIFAMPPKEKLSDEAIADLERWVTMGAPWPEASSDASSEMTAGPGAIVDRAGGESLDREIDIEAARDFWSFRPVERPAVPEAGADWALSGMDRFLAEAMQDAGVKPVGDADERTWLRRVTFDLTGLPPTQAEIAAFLADDGEERHAHVVDRLLASYGFGERFGRHWLDVARYGESSGKETNVVYPHAWRYRDWVIEAMGNDMPYDEFLRKQLAGDLLPAKDATERAWNQIATGYLALGPKSHNSRDARRFALDVADEQIDAVTQGMLGITLACARCHDHKFDPFPIEDYYSLAGIFLSSETLFGTTSVPGNSRSADLIELPDGAGLPNGPRMDPGVRKLLARTRDRGQKDVAKASAEAEIGDVSMDRDEQAAAARRLAQVERRAEARVSLVDDLLLRFDERGMPTKANRMAMGMAESQPRDIAVLERGELDRPGEVAPRRMPAVLSPPGAPSITSGSGRLELAEWIASEENPLTARVWVNRVWQHMFGEGIVRSPDNFGAGGKAPSHPELLDWLASELVANGWSTKALVREIALSRAYRLDSAHDARNAQKDPEASLLWRMPERRLEAEAIRDAMLVASGALSPERPVGSPTGAFEGTLRAEQITDFMTREVPVRSVYLASLRGEVVDLLDAFDAPDTTLVSGKREVTTVATQALYLMNDADVLLASDAFADRLLRLDGSDTERIEAAFEIALGRKPSSAERRFVQSFLRDYEKTTPVEAEPEFKNDRERRRAEARAKRRRSARERAGGFSPAEAETLKDPRRAAWSAFAQSLFQSAEFRALG